MDAKHWWYRVEEDGARIDGGEIVDPFITTRMELRGWRLAWRVLTRGVTLHVTVSGDTVADVKVFDDEIERKAQEIVERRLRDPAKVLALGGESAAEAPR